MVSTLDDVRRIASLARLRTSREEERALPGELSRVVELVARLGEAPRPEAAGTEPAGDVEGVAPPLREADDEPGECLPREVVLANAPAAWDGYIRVPPVLPAEGGSRCGKPHPASGPQDRRVRLGAPENAPAAPGRGAEPDAGAAPRAWGLCAEELAARVRRRELRAEDAVRSCLARIRRVEPLVGAFVGLHGDAALARARELDDRLDAGDDPGPLAGVPVAVKDNLSLAGHPLTCASRSLAGYVAPFTATAVARLEAAGAVVLGQTELDEFAMGSSTETSAAGETVNPRSGGAGPDRRVPGGSSGGSAAAVASGAVPLALGSDTGGSVRQPAAFCGVVGLRPTWGRVSRWGLVAHASSLDTVGPLARTVRDAALALAVTAGADPRDATSADRPAEDCLARIEGGVEGVRVGRLRELDPSSPGFIGEAVSPEARAVWEGSLARLASLGAELVEVSVPAVASALAAYYLIATSEASSNLARFDGVRYGGREGEGDLLGLYEESRSRGFGAEVKRRILLGTFALSAGYAEEYYGRARDVRRALVRGFAAAFGRADLLITPTAAGGAFALGSRSADPVAMYRSDLFTVPAALAGLPAVSVPAGADGDGLPLGLQVTGPAFAEARLLRAARAFEAATTLPFEPVADLREGRVP